MVKKTLQVFPSEALAITGMDHVVVAVLLTVLNPLKSSESLKSGSRRALRFAIWFAVARGSYQVPVEYGLH